MMTALLFAVALVALSMAALVIFTAITAHRVEKALPPRGQFFEIAGARIHYLDNGSGPPIVILHGLGGQMGNFTYALLERLTPQFRVILIDRPGSGYSRRAPGATGRPTEQATLIAEFIRKLDLHRPLLVGHSLGGAIALGVALDHPQSIMGLALIAPLTHLPKQVPAPFRALDIKSDFLRWLVAWTVATPIGIRLGKAILDAIFSPEPAPVDFPIRGGGILGLRPQSFFNTSSDLRAASLDLPSMVNRYSSLQVPVRILYGTSDKVLSPKLNGEAMKAKSPMVSLELVSGGHMLPITSPDLTAKFITDAARSESAVSA
ncbi:MAG TPA: alpha/beta hydrolase [Candidatus Limnocylindrales bacterium]|jgi:pimeloyl-ACP methyl ester carboxylesterase|nr:alpha/beta hydrolase [Candidatus Limnocylindrales bacterium]